MEILRHIFEGKNTEIKTYYTKHKPQEIEILLTFSLYGASKDLSALETLKTVTELCYKQDNNEIFKEKFAQLVRTHIGLDYAFFDKMKNTDVFKDFAKEYGNNIKEKINLLEEEIKLGKVNIHNSVTLDELQKINEILLENPQIENQQTIPPYPSPYPLDWRVCEMQKSINKEHEEGIERELTIKSYIECKLKGLPVTHIDKIISKTRKIRNDFINNSKNENESFSPFLYCLHKDILKVVTDNNLDKIFCYNNLWDNINKYNLNNVSKSDFEIIELPTELKDVSNESKVRRAIWVLKKNGEAFFGGRHTLTINKDDVHHIDLANGENVVSAGTILFSKDMKKVVAINPGSGHYRPSIESCVHMIEAINKSILNTKDAVICDLNWNPTNINNTTVLAQMNYEKISSNVLSIRGKCLKSNLIHHAALNIPK